MPKTTYTDEEILQTEHMTTQIAADYLGITVTMVQWQMRQDALNDTHKFPIGIAQRSTNRGRWIYTIIPQHLVNYKNGTTTDLYALADKLLNVLNEFQTAINKNAVLKGA